MGIRGNVKAISKQNNSVLISYIDPESQEEMETWFGLGDRVKLIYLKQGPCEFTADPGTMTVNYVKCEGAPNQAPNRGFGQSFGPKKAPFKKADEYSPDSNDEMKRMSALKSASRIYEGTGKEEDFKRLTNEIGFFIETGHWKAQTTNQNQYPKEEDMGDNY